MFERDEVAATIVEYRPVFVTGDVTRPGEQAFRPRMTARQALASAGGFSALARANATSFDAANLRSEYITVWLTLAREHARVWRIKTELGENIDLDQKAIPPAPVPDTTISQIVSLELEYRKASASDHERQKDFLRRSIEQADKQILVLSEQKQNEDEGVQADAQDLQKAKAAFGGKARMLSPEEVLAVTGHPVGGVSPFGLATALPVYCDVSLKTFDEVVPAAGSTNSALRINPIRMANLLNAEWVDVCQTESISTA